MRKNNPVQLLRTVTLIEAVSFLVLLGVAMPLKHLAGMPAAVKVFGWVHGVLFMAVCALLVQVMIVGRWPMGRGALVLVAALLPLGPFVLDRRMKAYASAFDAGTAQAAEPP